MRHIKLQLLLLISLFFTMTLSFSETAPQVSAAVMLKQATTGVVNIKAYGVISPNAVFEEDEKKNENSTSSENTKQKKQAHHFISAGSGIIISAKNGLIVTNAHVIKDAEKIIVTLKDGQQYAAKKIGVDEASDIAVLKINAKNLVALPIANSNYVEVGDKIYAIGNPFGMSTSVTSGIVSALDRNDLNLEQYENFIQIDASINPGNSGGALVNSDGGVIGMNTAILTAEDNGGSIGIGFAIPSNMLTAVIPQLIKYGKVERGVVGVLAQDFSTTLANAMQMPHQEGAIITSVMPYSPAQNAHIQVGDIITRIDDTPVHTASQVVNTIGFLRVGTKVKLTLLRQGKIIETCITIMSAEKQKMLVQQHTPYFSQVSLQNISFYSPENGYINGVALVKVERDSSAWIAGLRTGDVVLSANNKSVSTVEALQKIIAKAKDTLTLLVLRHHRVAFIVVTPELTEDNNE